MQVKPIIGVNKKLVVGELRTIKASAVVGKIAFIE
jgi:hypothetical protein